MIEMIVEDRAARLAEATTKAKRMMSAARSRAGKKGIPYSLGVAERRSVESSLMSGRCDLSGCPFGTGPFAPTLDRIQPARGYVPGNVRVIIWLMNAALGDWGEATLRDVMEVWLDG